MNTFVYTASTEIIVDGRKFAKGQFVPMKIVARMKPEDRAKLNQHEVKKIDRQRN